MRDMYQYHYPQMNRKTYHLVCQNCGKEFTSDYHEKMFCGVKCKQEGRMKANVSIKVCKQCGHETKEWYINPETPYTPNEVPFCSKKCFDDYAEARKKS